MSNCREFSHFRDPNLDIQHHRILKAFDQLIWELEAHDKYEKQIVENPNKWQSHWDSHTTTLNKVKALRGVLVDHINHADTNLFKVKPIRY
uniref:Uncharacterized protein n=1 Tax=Marseillevirus LCMAC201 TaxID=2506605 RepID=A0A481YXM0_9VIRU|nr:MAG: hypothetical protein LCMAC201_05740 [Marseillevirus LCMAC201]